jgi:hypothetical protein
MSAQIIDLAHVRSTRASATALPNAHSEQEPANSTVFQFWRGASGNRYVHSIYNLFECPPLPAGNYILVRRDADGTRTVLSIGRTANETGSNNLAAIRQRSALIGANEVHVHLLAGSDTQSALIEADLQTLVARA